MLSHITLNGVLNRLGGDNVVTQLYMALVVGYYVIMVKQTTVYGVSGSIGGGNVVTQLYMVVVVG